MRRNIGNIVWGVILIIIGVGLIGEVFDLWNYSVFFKGWWTLFIILPALASMIQNGIRTGNSIAMGIGVLLLLSAQNIIPDGLLFKIAVPAVLIIIGLSILSKAIFKNSSHKATIFANNATVNSEDNPSYLAIFSGNTIKNNSTNFQGGSATALFGSNEIDLSDAVLKGDVEFSVLTIFGGSEVAAPKSAHIEIQGFPILGSNENSAVSSADPAAHKIVFRCTSIFGGTEIK